MAEHLSVQPKKRKKIVIEFDIQGEDFTFTAPKKALAVLPVLQEQVESAGFASMKSQWDWINMGLGEKQSLRIKEILEDEDNDFDWDDLENLSEWIMKQVNDRPTG